MKESWFFWWSLFWAGLAGVVVVKNAVQSRRAREDQAKLQAYMRQLSESRRQAEDRVALLEKAIYQEPSLN